MQKASLLLLLTIPAILFAQSPSEDKSEFTSAILARLDKLERQNEELTTEIRALRSELAAGKSTSVEDRVAVTETRVEEQAQTKVEASQRFPVSLNGMLLFNAFTNNESGYESGFYTNLLGSENRSGATLAQTLLGFEFNGPELKGGGKVSGSLNMDFLSGLGNSNFGTGSYGYALRIRRAVVNVDWPHESVRVGVDKPLISAREPNSLAEVGYGALSDAGNLWLWVPQARYGQHFNLSERTSVDAEGAVLQTWERAAFVPGDAYYSLEPTRPAFEARVNVSHRWSDERKFEIAPGVHVSQTHVDGSSVPSRFVTLDWSLKPQRWIEFSGLVFGGHNMANLGGFADGWILRNGLPPLAVKGIGGWTQVSLPVTSRLTINAFGGLQAPRTADLETGAVTHVAEYAGNLIYRLGPNLLVGLEALQERAGYFETAHAIRNHYDLAIGYLF